MGRIFSTSNLVAGRAALMAAGLLLSPGAALPALAVAKHEAPIPAATLQLMSARGTSPGAPILMRAFKKEAELEVWKRAKDGRYVHLKTFPICRWSGQLGPKGAQGDRQTPEGFYSITPKQLNPNSSYYLSFDLGFPNAYDQAHGASGSYLMVHGACSSAGCFAMTDEGIGEIYALVREAFAGGQRAFQFQSFPFRMTAQNLVRHRTDPNLGFWRQLKEGSDRFEATGQEPSVGVADKRYVFGPFKDGAKEALAQERLAQEKTRMAGLLEDGIAAVRTTYEDGGQHPTFTAQLRRGLPLGLLSRPEALTVAGREVVVIPARKKAPPPTQVAAAKPAPKDMPQPIVVAALPPSFVPLFSPRPLDTPSRNGGAPTLISGSPGILTTSFSAASFEVASTEASTITP